MSDREALIIIVDYLDALERDLFADYNRASDDIKPVISAKVSVISELIDHIESATGIEVRMCD